MLVGEARLVGEGVDDVHPSLAAPTVGPGAGDGVADATVQQPPRAALVQALVPCGVQLAGGSQRGVELLTVLHSFVVGEAVVVAGVEHLAWETVFETLLFVRGFRKLIYTIRFQSVV